MRVKGPIPMLRRAFTQHISNHLSTTPSFLAVHRVYFLTTIFVCSIIFWLISTPHASVPFIDSLFVVVSAITSTGLTTRNLSTFNTAQQILLWILIVIGSPIFISVSVVWVRRRAFESKFATVIQGKHLTPESISSDTAPNNSPAGISMPEFLSIPYPALVLASHDIQGFAPHTGQDSCADEKLHEQNHNRSTSTVGACARRDDMLFGHSKHHESLPTLKSKDSKSSFLGTVRVIGNAMVGRNSQFYGLAREEREQLACIEYNALKLLSVLVPVYIFTFQFVGSLLLGAFISSRQADTSYENGIKPWWTGVFYGVSAFNNAGMSLLDQNVIQFGTSYYFLLTVAFLTLAGNTAYPIFLRLILWIMLYLTPQTDFFLEWRESMAFILQYPRRVYTHLFPSTLTWWLVLVLFVLNGIDFISFEALNRHNPLLTSLSAAHRNLDGLVQTIFIRTAGFTVISISSLRIGLQALYVPMMFISAFPVAIIMRSSNVYEERSLGIYASQLPPTPSPPPSSARPSSSILTQASRTRLYFLRQQLAAQLSHDLWFVVLCAIAIIWIETSSYDRAPLTFSVFNILFEVISAYACVGLSIGLPDQQYALSGAFHSSSKLILCFLMFRGRHRDLPVAIDRAVQLPDNVFEARLEGEERVGTRESLGSTDEI